VIDDVHEIKDELERLVGPGYCSPGMKRQTAAEVHDTSHSSPVTKQQAAGEKRPTCENKTGLEPETAVESSADVMPPANVSPVTGEVWLNVAPNLYLDDVVSTLILINFQSNFTVHYNICCRLHHSM
jgi:hypothetical protein